MKVKYMQSMFVNNELSNRDTCEVEEEFDTIDDAASYIDAWLKMEEKILQHYGFTYERKGNIIRWSVDRLMFVEVFDITV